MSLKSIWNTMDRLEGKKPGSTYAALQKERKRQGYGKALTKKKGHSKARTD